MGNTKSIPVVGETVTAVESTVKIAAAGVIAPFDKEEAKKLAKGAGDAWVEYSEKNLIVGPINSGIRYLSNDKEGAKRVIESTGKAFESVVDNTPVVGHVKGVVHLAAGDEEHGKECLIGSTRTTAVIGAGLATGGLGGGMVAGGLAGVGGGVAYDGIHSAIDSGVHEERRTHGIWNIDEDAKACKDANDIADWELGIAGTIFGDFLAGGSAAEAAKASKKAGEIKSKQNVIKNEIKDKVPGVDPKLTTKDIVESARHTDKYVKDGTLKGDGHVCSTVRNTETGETYKGLNSRARRNINTKNYELHQEKSGFSSKTQAKKIPQTSELMKEYPEVKPALKRNPATCAEQDAFNKVANTTPLRSAAGKFQVVSVMFKNGVYETVIRCKNCLAYAEAMGNVITDKISGLPVPVDRITPLVTKACKCGALAVGVEILVETEQNKHK